MKIFISYSSKDSKLFDIPRLAKDIEALVPGVETFYFEGYKGSNWLDYMNEKIAECDLFIMVCTPNALQSPHVKVEWKAAYSVLIEKKPENLLPIFFEDKFVPPMVKTNIGVKFDMYNIDGTISKLISIISDKYKNFLDDSSKDGEDGSKQEKDKQPLSRDPRIVNLLEILLDITGVEEVLIIENLSGSPITGILKNNSKDVQMFSGFISSMGMIAPPLFNGELDFAFVSSESQTCMVIKKDYFSIGIVVNKNMSIEAMLNPKVNALQLIITELSKILQEGAFFNLEENIIIRKENETSGK